MNTPHFDLPSDGSTNGAGSNGANGWNPEQAKAPTGPAAPSAFDSLMAEFTLRAGDAGLVQAPDAAAAPTAPSTAASFTPAPLTPAPLAPPQAPLVGSSAFSQGDDAIPSYALPGYAQPPEYQAPKYEPVATWNEPVAAPAPVPAEQNPFELLGLIPPPAAEPVLLPPPAGLYVEVEPELQSEPVRAFAPHGEAEDLAAPTIAFPVVGSNFELTPPVFAPHVPVADSVPASDVPTQVLPTVIPDATRGNASAVDDDFEQIVTTFAPQLPALKAPSGAKSRVSRAVALEPDVSDTSTMTDGERATLANADQDLVSALQQVVLQRASDLHVTVNAAPTLRVDGGLRPATEEIPWSRSKVTSALLSLLDERQAARFEEALELDFAFTISANARFRVNFYQQRGAIGAAFRLIPTEIKKLAELGVPDTVAMFARLPRGLVLVTGPTGSGKSTTLAALIDLVNEERADHIVTVEDPIEFMHTHKKSLVNQREVGSDTHSFTAALKHVLRQDPDVILVGELRDLETISVALTAAETGHLVFATLHTQSAPQTIDRIIDVFPPFQQEQVRAQLALTLQGVVCQTLVKRASGNGRAVATEILVTTPAVSNLIREGQTHQITAAMQAGGQFGMRTLDQHLAELVNSGVVTRAAARDKSQDLDSLEQLITRSDNSRPTNALSSGINYRDAYTENLG